MCGNTLAQKLTMVQWDSPFSALVCAATSHTKFGKQDHD